MFVTFHFLFMYHNEKEEEEEEQSDIELDLLETEAEINIPRHRSNKSIILFIAQCCSFSIFGLCILIGFIYIIVGLTLASRERYVLYLTDIHLDPNYQETGSLHTYCRNINETSSRKFKYGRYGCSTPPILLESLYKYLPSIAPRPKLIIFGGDFYTSENNDQESILSSLKGFKAKMKEMYPETPILFTLGNREYANNYGKLEDDQLTFKKIYEIFYEDISNSSESFLESGSYYIDFKKYKTRFISFNTPIYSKARGNISNGQNIDLYNQFRTLERMLDTHLKTVLVMHVQPGISFVGKPNAWHSQYIQQLGKVFSKNQPTYILTSHLHNDNIMPVFGTSLIALCNPSVSPRLGNNPSFRLYYIDKHSLYDYSQFSADIHRIDTIPKWKFEYRFSEAYMHHDLSQHVLNRTIQDIQTNPAKRWTFLQHLHSGAVENGPFYECIQKSYSEEEYNICISNLQ